MSGRAATSWPRLAGALIAVLAVIAMLPVVAARQQPPLEQWSGLQGRGIRFQAIDVFVDSGATPLGAYQIEIKATRRATPTESVRLVGVEGGEHAAYKSPPHYDPAALHENQLQDHIVIAAFSTAADLPSGKTRVARLHVEVTGPEPVYSLTLTTAGAADGHKIDATATYAPAESGGTGDGR